MALAIINAKEFSKLCGAAWNECLPRVHVDTVNAPWASFDSIMQCVVSSGGDNEDRVVFGQVEVLHIFHRVFPSERIYERPELFMYGVGIIRQAPRLR